MNNKIKKIKIKDEKKLSHNILKYEFNLNENEFFRQTEVVSQFVYFYCCKLNNFRII